MKTPLRLLVGPLRGALLCALAVLVTLLPVTALPQDASATPAILALPKTFEGSISVSQAHAPSESIDGEFGYYGATATFSKLTFGKGSEGPYTLLKGNLTYSGFDITQTVGGSTGTCDATYHFGLDAAKPLFGDLSFSETGGKAVVGLELQIATVGSITTSSGCGPNNESTSHVFGGPEPRISFPISAQGTWDQQTGTVTFDDANKHSYLGGSETDVVKGKLTGGLQIFFEENRRLVNVTDSTTTVVVGEQINLSTLFADGSTPDLAGKGWTGITSPTAVDNYDFYNQFARSYPLEYQEFSKRAISFYWVKAPDEATEGGAYTVDVTGLNRKTGEDETAETTFDVVAPPVAAFGAVTCGAGVNRTENDPKRHLNAPELDLGLNNTAPGCNGVPGVAWSIDVTAPSIRGGKVAMLQLVNETETHNGNACTQGGFKMDGSRTIADGGRAYLAKEPLLDAGEQWKTDPRNFNDSPSVGLHDGGTWLKSDTFTDYLMFQPVTAGSIWVALAQMGPWTWSGTAEIRGGRWVLTAYQNPAHVLSSAQATALPEWNGVIGLYQPVTDC